MNNSKPFMNLSGAMDIIKKSKNPLTPIYEAMTNSLEALTQKGLKVGNSVGEISIILHFTGVLDQEKDLEQILITDNGIGFTDENYDRFLEFFDKSKGYKNRGTGRIQFFHRFQRIKIDSVFEKDGAYFKRTFICTKSNFVTLEELNPALDTTTPVTTVKLSEYLSNNAEKMFFNSLTVEKLTAEITSNFILRFYLDNKKEGLQVPRVKVSIFKAGESLGERIIDPNSIPEPHAEGKITVPYMQLSSTKEHKFELTSIPERKEDIKWAHFVLTDKELEKNGIYLCSKDVPIQAVRFDQLKKNENLGGHRYLTAFYGDVLDDPKNVSDSVDSFKFLERKDVEKMPEKGYFDFGEEYLLIDTILEEVNKAIPIIYKDVIDVLDEQQKDIQSIAKAHGIPANIINKANIHISDNEKTITKKLFSTQSIYLAEKSYKAKQLFESLKTLDPTSETYQEDIRHRTIEFSSLVGEQDKEELSRYIIRREMVIKILKKILDKELDYQNAPKEEGKNKDHEGLIHDLIFKRKSVTTHALNDLWILNEEFMHFDGCSELKLNQIKTSDGEMLLKDVSDETVKSLGLKLTRRPDIFLYAEEEKCLIIELKEPTVDMSNYLNQMPRYCTLIANLGVKKLTNFYCYLIGENINPIDLGGEYKETVNGDWIKQGIPIVTLDANRNVIANAQIEVIRLSSIHARAHRRNLSFADKLGIRDLLNHVND